MTPVSTAEAASASVLHPAAERAADGPQRRREDIATISFIGLSHGTSHFFHLLLAAPLFPFLAQAFSVSYTQLGLLMTVFFTVSAIVQAGAGFVVDRVGARPVLYFAISCFAVAAFSAAAAPMFWTLYASAALAGLGNGVFHPVNYSILNARVAKPRLGHAFSVHGITGNLGWAFAPVFLAGIAAATSWRHALAAAGCAALASLAVLFSQRKHLDDSALAAQRAAERQSQKAGASNALAFMANPAVWMCWTFFFFTTMAVGAIQSFAPTVATLEYGFSAELSSTIITVYMVVSAVGMLLGGWVVAKFDRYDGIIAVALAISALAAVLIAAKALAGLGMLLLLAVMGFGAGIAGPSRDMLIRAAATKGALGRVYGVVYSGLDVGLMVAPALFGWLLDHGHTNKIFAFVAVFQTLAILTAWRVGSRTAQAAPVAA